MLSDKMIGTSKRLDIITADLDKQISVNITINIPKDNYTNFYIDGVRNWLSGFDEKYAYTHNLYKNTPHLESKLREIGAQPQVDDAFLSAHSSHVLQPLDIGHQHTENLLEIKRQMDSIFSKYLPAISDAVSENTDGLDLELMDKITPLVPEGKEILLKNIVKELNGSAKGLSDFVIIFTKYRQAIINHNGIEYFQRKGCHFLRKI
jgi:hypothetical protein